MCIRDRHSTLLLVEITSLSVSENLVWGLGSFWRYSQVFWITARRLVLIFPNFFHSHSSPSRYLNISYLFWTSSFLTLSISASRKYITHISTRPLPHAVLSRLLLHHIASPVLLKYSSLFRTHPSLTLSTFTALPHLSLLWASFYIRLYVFCHTQSS